jgi:hypothetical protein
MQLSCLEHNQRREELTMIRAHLGRRAFGLLLLAPLAHEAYTFQAEIAREQAADDLTANSAAEFLKNKDRIGHDIGAAAARMQIELDEELKIVPKECFDVVNGNRTIAGLAECGLSDDRILKIEQLVRDRQAEIDLLASYVTISPILGRTRLDAKVEYANEAISDADDSGIFNDWWDDPYAQFTTGINSNDEIESSPYSGREKGYIGELFFGFVGYVGIMYLIRTRKSRRESNDSLPSNVHIVQ